VRTHTHTHTDRHTPLTTRPCGLRRAGNNNIRYCPEQMPYDPGAQRTLQHTTPRRLHVHVHVQDAARPNTTVLVGRLSAHFRRKSPTTVIRHVHICRATRLDDRSFAVVGPQIWNSLLADLCLVDSYARFRRLLKGHMFG